MERVLNEPALFSNLGQRAHKTIKEEFSLKKLAKHLQDLVTSKG
jgi:hypothetical protein